MVMLKMHCRIKIKFKLFFALPVQAAAYSKKNPIMEDLRFGPLYNRHTRGTPVWYRTVRVVPKRLSVSWQQETDYRHIYYGGDHGLIHHRREPQEHREHLLKQRVRGQSQEALCSCNTLREHRPAGAQVHLRVGGAVSSQPGVRGQRSSSRGEDPLLEAIMNLHRQVDGEGVKRRTVMSFRNTQIISISGSLSPARPGADEHRPSSSDLSGGSAHAPASASRNPSPLLQIFFSDLDEIPGLGGEPEDPTLEERCAQAIDNKALEIEELYKQDCETFGIVVKMLISKDPTLEPMLLSVLHKNLVEIGEKYLENLSQFISEVNALVKPNQTGQT
ncbi:uncharacterized protein LOC132125072 isoform X2 [Carassius carassius]|uniref:uncharacterized protein LOC132125072 isoform X2 n=1 Tax=Carassius carassius TaxID=217509 RepID=UPI002868B1D7|nr:uncharacterized protein LOC132125072 isoform X2 [Carassius carassius]